MKKTLAILFASLLLLTALSCQAINDQQKPAMTEYLKAVNVTLNFLPQASQVPTPGKDLNAVNQPQTNAILTQSVGKYQNGLQSVKSEKVPDIADAKSFHETSLVLVGDTLNVLQKMQTALNSNNQSAWSQSVDDYAALLPRVTAYYRNMESLLNKYNIADTDVDYRFRGK